MKHMKGIAIIPIALALVAASSASATTLEVTTVTQNQGVTFTLSLKSGTSIVVKNTSGATQNTCTGSHAQGFTTTYTGSAVTGPLSGGLSVSKCTRAVTIHNPGALVFEHIAGTTNGAVVSEELDITVNVPIAGYVRCSTEEVGTLTGVSSGNATLDMGAVLNCGSLSLPLEGTYTVTIPEGFAITA